MKLQSQKINIKSENGIALILALIIVTMLLLLTLSAFEMVTANAQISDNHIRDLQALYIAEAGIDHAIYELRYKDYPATPIPITGSCGPGEYTATYTDTGDKGYSIDSRVSSMYGSTNENRKIEVYIRLLGEKPYIAVITSWKEI
jgi:Tfp pilus assembly protein PilX